MRAVGAMRLTWDGTCALARLCVCVCVCALMDLTKHAVTVQSGT